MGGLIYFLFAATPLALVVYLAVKRRPLGTRPDHSHSVTDVGIPPDTNREFSGLVQELREQYERLSNNLADAEYRRELWAEIIVKQQQIAELIRKIGD